MPQPSERPISIPRKQRLLLAWRLRRAWRAGRWEQRQVTLDQIRRSALGATPVRIDHDSGVTTIVFGDGIALRVGPCHRPAVRALRAALAPGGDVYLAQASDHGRCWGLYFAGPAGRLALLALELRLVRQGGGDGPVAAPMAPAPHERILQPA